MELKVYSVRDAKGEIFHQPFHQKTHGEAERTFKMMATDDKTTLAKFPEDYDLYFLGTFDDVSGKYCPLDTPQHMLKAVQVMNS